MVVDDHGTILPRLRHPGSSSAPGYPGRRVFVAFSAHRYTCTRDLLSEFAPSPYADVQRVYARDIYAAGERRSLASLQPRCLRASARAGIPDAHYVD